MRGLHADIKTAIRSLRGLTLIRVVEIQWEGGSAYYSDQPLTSPVEASADVLDWGQIQLSAEPGQIGGYGQFTLRLSDPDNMLSDEMAAVPLTKIRVRVFVHIVGQAWAKRIESFRGFISGTLWEPTRGAWSLTLKPIQETYATTLGTRITADLFPEIICQECDGQYIPIVFGRPVYRVPVCGVARPGSGYLARPFGPCDTQLELTTTAERLGFQSGTNIAITLTNTGDSEIITGFFSSPDSTVFNVVNRSSWAAIGQTAGYYASEGLVTVTIYIADVLPAYRENGLGGYPIIFPGKFSGCEIRICTNWLTVGPSEGQVGCYLVGENETFPGGGGQRYMIFNRQVPTWPAGTSVSESGPTTYIVNYLPSEEVERIEVRGKAEGAVGQTVTLFFTMNPVYWVVNYNDKAFNATLGRAPTDPGVTTVTLLRSPRENGAENDIIYCTMKGTVYQAAGGQAMTLGGMPGEAIWKPAHVILELLTHPLLGKVSPVDVDLDSFAAASALTQTRFAFAIRDEKKLQDAVSQLAQQACCVLFWDSKATLSSIAKLPSAPAVKMTIRPEHTLKGSVRISDPDYSAKYNRLAMKVAASSADEPGQIIRRSQELIDQIGLREKSMDGWGFQAASSAAESARIWLRYEVSRGRTVELTTFLNGVSLQPGDVVKIYASFVGSDGLKKWPINGELFRLNAVDHAFGNPSNGGVEQVRIKGTAFPWEYAIEAAEPDRDCATIQRIDRAPIDDSENLTTAAPGGDGGGTTAPASTVDPASTIDVSTPPASTNPPYSTYNPSTPAYTGPCAFKAVVADGELGWEQQGPSGCPNGCGCDPPQYPPSYPGQQASGTCQDCTTTPPPTTPAPTTTASSSSSSSQPPTSFPNSSFPPPVPGPCYCGALNFFEVIGGDGTLYYPTYDSLPGGGGCWVEVPSVQLGSCFGNIRLECHDGEGWTGTINVGGEVGEIPLDVTVNSEFPYDITVEADGVCSGVGHFWQYVP
jgi:hypothetical protein